jgi:dihydrofolate synthase/folylpolyglutamate synthase
MKRGVQQDAVAGLREVEAVDGALGHPCAGTRVIHVVGTNGKGSTSSMCAHTLRGLGLRVGLYTSPHLHRINERIVVDADAISDNEMKAALERVDAAEGEVSARLSFFEALTLAALVHFAGKNVDVVVLEAGLGGRLDATRIRTSAVILFARIDFDHEAYLGNTLAAIAGEKAAVMHKQARAFSVQQVSEVRDVLVAFAQSVACELKFVEPLLRPPHPFRGDHQTHNGALAFAGVRALLPDRAVEHSLLDGAKWPGRLEEVAIGGGTLIFDVAHNLNGIEAFVAYVQHHPVDVVVFGTMADKRVEAMLKRLGALQASIWWAAPAREGAAPAPDGPTLSQRFRDVEDEALAHAIAEKLSIGQRVALCGSHFVVAPLRARFLGVEWRAGVELCDPVRRQRE